MQYSFYNFLFCSRVWIRKTKYLELVIKEGSTKIVNFITSGAEVLVLELGHIRHIVKLHYFFKNLFLYNRVWIGQTEYIVIMTKERSTIIRGYDNHKIP